MNKCLRALAAGLLAVAGLLPFAGASPVAAQAATARVSVGHFSPDAPAVDVFVDGARAISGLAFTQTTDYLPVPAGARLVQVVPAGATIAQGPVVISATLNLVANTNYSVFAVGRLAQIRAVVGQDDLSAPAAGQAKIRVLHASPDAPTVDVAVRGGPVLVPNLAFGVLTPYIQVPAGSYDIELRPAGTMTAAATFPGVRVQGGEIRTVVARGLLQGTPALGLTATLDQDFPNLRTAAPAAPAPAPAPTAPADPFAIIARLFQFAVTGR
ncbi:MAG: DUF4397 domain-containing protein [Dehalococcoidia bacterium]|nr:DUF4397 domain-containing protein [Dehalococcoidia bacterium]